MRFIISNTDPAPIYDQLATQIRQLIMTGELNAGDMLPSIRRLAMDLEISVITTKRAYDDLEREGFVTTTPGKGTFVAEQNMELLREKKRRDVEQLLASAVDLAVQYGIPYEDLSAMLQLLTEDQS